MNTVREALRVAGNLLSAMSLTDFLDIIIVAYVIYKLLTFVRRTSASGLIKGIVLIVIVLWISKGLQLTMVNYLLGKTMELGVIALIVLFQPEIRNFLTTAGSSLGSVFERKAREMTDIAVTNTVSACLEMSKTRTGALVVFERNVHLEEYIKSGTKLDAEPSTELIMQVFYPKTPLHDGAMIIIDGKVVAAGCMLPMSANTNLSRDLGMRHRAGIGISERSDAVVVIVSEETGSISVAINGMLKRKLTPDTFEMLLKSELIPEKQSFSQRVRKKVGDKNA